jgi:fermentation-respiration switch protein FrsA (DUF1100 family)
MGMMFLLQSAGGFERMLWFLGALALISVLVISGFCYRIVFRSPNIALRDPYAIPPGEQYKAVAEEMLQKISLLEKSPYQQVTIKAWDGTLLAARYYHLYEDAPVQIFFHGYRSNALREFACGYSMAQRLGYNALVVDQRAHGNSEGHTISFGIKERYDCLDWCNYVKNRFGENVKVFLSGVSMGAATVLMAADLNLPRNVVAITADCPYVSPGRIIRKVSRDVKLPCWAVYPFVVLGALVFGGFRIWDSSAVRSVKKTSIPILLIHGDDDRFVPCDMSREIYDACCADKTLVSFPTAGHGLSCLTDPTRYENTMRQFLLRCGVPVK